MKQHGPWQIVRSREVHRDPWVAVQMDDVIHPDGKPGTYTVVHLKPGVSVLPIDADGSVYLAEEFHYGVSRTTIEAVAGGMETGETPLYAAQRELREELGIQADEWIDLGTVDPFTANVVSPTSLFLARSLAFTAADREGSEQITMVRLPLAEAVAMVLDSRITNGPSCVLILKAERWLERQRRLRSE